MTDREIDVLIDEEKPKPRWRRSRAGNLFRVWNGVRLVVYWKFGTVRFCIDDGNTPPRFGGPFDSEVDAVVAGLEALEEGGSR